MSYCHECNQEYEPGAMLCSVCGGKLTEDGTGAGTTGWSTDDAGPDETATGRSSTDAETARTTGWSSDERGSDWMDTSTRQGAIPTATETTGPSRAGHGGTSLFEFSFTFPFDRSGKPLVIHSVLVFFGLFLVVPMFFALGYSYRVGRAAARGDESLPTFDDWGGMGKDGLILAGVLLGVTITFAAMLLTLVVAITAVGGDSLLVVLLVGIGILLVLAGSYVAGAILPVLIGTGSLQQTFSDGRIVDFALSVHYLKGVLSYIAFSIVLSIAVNVISFVLTITIVGIVLLLPLFFAVTAYQLTLLFTMWGYIYNEAAAAGDVSPVEPDAPLGFE